MKKNLPLIITLVTVVLLGGLGAYGYNQYQIQVRQTYIHDRGVIVMPFDLDKTTHFFTQTDHGGIQKIQAKDPQDTEQIELIRHHLQKETDLFNQGNFSDPSSLHGSAMPGLSVLEQSTGKLAVEYSDLPDGGQITYLTDDPGVIDALHRWFMAQLQDHGMDAMEY